MLINAETASLKISLSLHPSTTGGTWTSRWLTSGVRRRFFLPAHSLASHSSRPCTFPRCCHLSHFYLTVLFSWFLVCSSCFRTCVSSSPIMRSLSSLFVCLWCFSTSSSYLERHTVLVGARQWSQLRNDIARLFGYPWFAQVIFGYVSRSS